MWGFPGTDFSGGAGAVDMDQEFKASRGAPVPEGQAIASEEAVIEAMKTVYDPEIPVNIYDLGLIYTTVVAEDGAINIEMSLTAPGCPVAGEMPGMVADAVTQVPGTGIVEVLLVWEPAWTQDRMSPDAQLALGMF